MKGLPQPVAAMAILHSIGFRLIARRKLNIELFASVLRPTTTNTSLGSTSGTGSAYSRGVTPFDGLDLRVAALPAAVTNPGGTGGRRSGRGRGRKARSGDGTSGIARNCSPNSSCQSICRRNGRGASGHLGARSITRPVSASTTSCSPTRSSSVTPGRASGFPVVLVGATILTFFASYSRRFESTYVRPSACVTSHPPSKATASAYRRTVHSPVVNTGWRLSSRRERGDRGRFYGEPRADLSRTGDA